MSTIGERLARIEVHTENAARIMEKLENGDLPICRQHADAIRDLQVKRTNSQRSLLTALFKPVGLSSIIIAVGIVAVLWMQARSEARSEARAKTVAAEAAAVAQTNAVKVASRAVETVKRLEADLAGLREAFVTE